MQKFANFKRWSIKNLHHKNFFYLIIWGRKLTISCKMDKLFNVSRKVIISLILPLKGNKSRERKTPLFDYNQFYLKKKKHDFPVCVAVWNPCEATLIWQPESRPLTHNMHKRVTVHSVAPRKPPYCFLPNFVVTCDLFLNRGMITWSSFVN